MTKSAKERRGAESDLALRGLCRELIDLLDKGAMVGDPDIDRDGSIDDQGDSVVAQIRAITGPEKPQPDVS